MRKMNQFISIYREFDKTVRDNYEKLDLKCLDEMELNLKKHCHIILKL